MHTKSPSLVGLAICAAIFLAYYSSCGAPVELGGSQEQATRALPVNQLNITGNVQKIDCIANNFDSPSYTFSKGTLSGKTLTYKSSSEVDFTRLDWPTKVSADWNALSGKLPFDASKLAVVVVDIKNVNGIPHYAYFSNGTFDRRDQNWSSTKVLAELAAVHKIRLASGFEVGAGGTVDGRAWSSLVKDLHDHSSNDVGEIFKLIAGYGANDQELNAQTFVRGWLARPPTELFNSGYGQGRRDTHFDVALGGKSVRIPVNRTNKTSNLLTPLTMAEFWKRLGVNRRDDRLMPKGNSLTQTYRSQSGGPNPFAPAGVSGMRTTITVNDLYNIMYGGVNTSANNATHTNGMVWDGGVRGRFNGDRLARSRIAQLSGQGGKFIAKTGSSIPNHSVFGGHVCLPGQNGREGREFAFFMLGHGHSGISSETVIKRSFERIIDAFAPEF